MRTLLFVAALSAALAGCAPATRVTLLQQANARPSAVEVKTASNAQTLTKPFEVAVVGQGGSISLDQTDAEEVRRRHPELLAMPPAQEERHTLYFAMGNSTLTPESEAALPAILSRAGARPGGELLVIGHTDRVGSVISNDALSLARARAIRERLIQQGFPALRIRAIGRGEREPAIQTADEVDEPGNRRVELIVR